MALFSQKPKGKPTQPTQAVKTVSTTPAAAPQPIQVSETGVHLEPWVEDAALLYATGKTGETATALNTRLLDPAGSKDITPWLMLFDLHEANGHKELFEDLALDFAVRFERSPPAWSPPYRPQTQAPSEPVTYTFGAQMGGVDKARLQHFLMEAERAPYTRLDFSHTPAPASAYARAILDCIERLRKLGKAIEVIGGPAFVVRLNSTCNTDRGEQASWLLLLAVVELMGDRNGFEVIALGYAVRFEMSPPSYTPPMALPANAPAHEPTPATPDTYIMEGGIGQKAATQLNALADFARGRSVVELDMARVTRIDFAATGQFLDTIIQLGAQGCHVVLKDCNSLVTALLRLIGADQLATLLPRKRV